MRGPHLSWGRGASSALGVGLRCGPRTLAGGGGSWTQPPVRSSSCWHGANKRGGFVQQVGRKGGFLNPAFPPWVGLAPSARCSSRRP